MICFLTWIPLKVFNCILISGVLIPEKAKIGRHRITTVAICAADFTSILTPVYMCCYHLYRQNPKRENFCSRIFKMWFVFFFPIWCIHFLSILCFSVHCTCHTASLFPLLNCVDNLSQCPQGRKPGLRPMLGGILSSGGTLNDVASELNVRLQW